MSTPTRLLFVCLGNICRSPLAEGIFIHQARQRGVLDRLTIDSAGTGGWHVGARADARSIAVARSRGVELPSRARQVFADEADSWDLVLAMDRKNQRDLLALGFAQTSVMLMRSFDRDAAEPDVPDPYHGTAEDFERVYAMLEAACAGLLSTIVGRGQHQPRA